MLHIYDSWVNGQKKQMIKQIEEARQELTLREIFEYLYEVVPPEERLAMIIFYEDHKYD